jgi:hypothetical protein
MKSKNDEISKLREQNKQKDEKMKIMSNIIDQLKEQVANKNMPHTNRDPKTTHIITGPLTRSRNNSPVVLESKRGRPPKYVYEKPAISPDASPPPRKKTAAKTHDLTQMDYSGSDSELPETSQRRNIR